MMGLTRHQHRLYEFIKARLEETGGVAPSFEEMKDEMGLSAKSGVHRLITALEERGLIRRLPNRARAIEIVPQRQVRPNPLLTCSDGDLIAEARRRGLIR